MSLVSRERKIVNKVKHNIRKKEAGRDEKHLCIIFLPERIFYVCVGFYAVHTHALYTCITRIVRLPRRLTFERGKRREYESEIEKERKRETELYEV